VKIGPAVGPGRRIEKKGKDSQKKPQSGSVSPICEEVPTASVETEICLVGHLADLITYANFQDDIFGVTILQGVKFLIFLLIFAWALQQCNATALPVITTPHPPAPKRLKSSDNWPSVIAPNFQ